MILGTPIINLLGVILAISIGSIICALPFFIILELLKFIRKLSDRE